ncbi:MAG: caspase family protein [Gammaproteobacteria bacterium]
MLRLNPSSKISVSLGGMLLICLISACDTTTPPMPSLLVSEAPAQTRGDLCPAGPATESPDGIRRLALIVGVGQYKNPDVPDLPGPPEDAKRFYRLLTDPNGFGFPVENVCLLLDEKAGTADFKASFQQALVQRARPQDVAVFYYAGHGSRIRDVNQDEADEWDETFMLHDARSGDVKDLLDDEFNRMLSDLYGNTHNITVVLDSCNSGTATRGDSEYIARFFDPPADAPESTDATSMPAVPDWTPESMPGIVMFTAASDGTPALEKNAHGIFTDAILAVLSQVSDEPTTYAQAARSIRPLVAAESYQIPYFQGDLNKYLFGNVERQRPYAWEVITTAPDLTLGGPPLPGLGIGAELKIFPGNATGDDTRDPAKAKATAVIDEMTGVNAKAHVTTVNAETGVPVPGDLAVLVRPADRFLKISVQMRPAAQPGGIPADLADKLEKTLADNLDARSVVNLSQDQGDFELSLNRDGHIAIAGPENTVRISVETPRAAIENLWQHARQKALLQLHGEGGSDFTDNETLKVQLTPAPKQSPCADGVWQQAEPNRQQIIPLCHQWQVKVLLAPDSPHPLLIGGAILSTDGSTFGFPADGRTVLLRPGQSTVFASRDETFMGTTPLDVSDHLLVFGTQENNPVPWHLLTSKAATRAGGAPKRGLYRALDRYLTPGSRGVGRPEENSDETTWTLSSLAMRVEANSRFLKPKSASTAPDKREYTLQHFDIRPYLPDDQDSKLYRLLRTADGLAKSSAEDGYGYKQHDWSAASDAENLKKGIDCSRAIWFAFTRSGLLYNSDNRYLSTAMMVAADSPMAEQFERCDNNPELRLGDILVYRDDTRGDGHVVVVIDPEKRIAWGSHGWDGNASELAMEPDTGVEYQLIKYKKDWERWDRKTMSRKACWRYRPFAPAAEWAMLRGSIGHKALKNACKASTQCRL